MTWCELCPRHGPPKCGPRAVSGKPAQRRFAISCVYRRNQHALCSYLRHTRFSGLLAAVLVRATTESSGASCDPAQVRETLGGIVMTRMSIAIAAALVVTASTVHAQNTHFTVSAA